MSVIIKGLKMPKSCYDCVLQYTFFRELHCAKLDGMSIQSKKLPYQENRHPDCPIVEIPDKHGRLIDVDELLEWYDNMRKDELEKFRESIKPSIKNEAMNKIQILDKLYFQIYDRQKTVVEAEGKEK